LLACGNQPVQRMHIRICATYFMSI